MAKLKILKWGNFIHIFLNIFLYILFILYIEFSVGIKNIIEVIYNGYFLFFLVMGIIFDGFIFYNKNKNFKKKVNLLRKWFIFISLMSLLLLLLFFIFIVPNLSILP